MIDEKLLIQELKEYQELMDSNTMKEVFDVVIKAINEQPKVGVWVLCSEELPKEAGKYAVLYHPCHGDYINSNKVCTGDDTFLGKTSWAKRKYQKVIAWQFLPKVPKGEEK